MSKSLYVLKLNYHNNYAIIIKPHIIADDVAGVFLSQAPIPLNNV